MSKGDRNWNCKDKSMNWLAVYWKREKKRLEQCKDKLWFGVGFSTTLQGVAAVANHMPEPEANDGYMLTSTYTLLQQWN